MNEQVKLYCSYDEDSQSWLVWFPHPLGGMHVMESFDNESDAKIFHQQQLNDADYSD